MALQLRRGPESNRKGNNDRYYSEGELIYITTTGKVFVGDGLAGTVGGVGIVKNFAGTGLTYDTVDNVLKIDNNNLGFTTDNISEGTNASKKFFTTARAAEAAKNMLVNGTHTGLTYTWHADTNTLDVALTSGGGGGLADLVSDTSPQLGGDLDLNGYDITGTGSLRMTGGLGTDLSLHGNSITGPGSIDILGSIKGGSLQLGSMVIMDTTPNTITIGATAPMEVVINGASDGTPLTIMGATTGSGALQPGVSIRSYRGGFDSKSSVQNGDNIGDIRFDSWSGSSWATAFYLAAKINDSSITSGEYTVGAELYLGSGTGDVGAGEFVSITAKGDLKAHSLTTNSFNGSSAYPSYAIAGTIIFDSSDNHFYGFNGTIWKQLDN